MRDLRTGDRVAVNDPGLAELRAIMRRYGHEPKPNHIGVIEHIEDGNAYIAFDDGGMAPYPLEDCELIEREDAHPSTGEPGGERPTR